MSNAERTASFFSVEERRQTLRGREIEAQRAIDERIFHDDAAAWAAGWIENGYAKLFGELMEGSPADETLIDLVLHQPERGSEEEERWAKQIYDRVQRARQQRDQTS